MNQLELYQKLASGDLSPEQAMEQAGGQAVLGHTVLDLDREKRTGSPEVIYGAGKTTEQLLSIVAALRERGGRVLVTRVPEESQQPLRDAFPDLHLEKHAAILTSGPPEKITPHVSIGVVAAGTSDHKVAVEARLTAEFYGYQVREFHDVGVAGIHRLFARLEEIRACDLLIVVAGMEGALPSVVGGLTAAPLIAVPTSVGYGAGAGGQSALLGMLNSCASGLTVVNIDNGFGAAAAAHRILRLATCHDR